MQHAPSRRKTCFISCGADDLHPRALLDRSNSIYESARHTEVPCRSHRLAVSPHGRRDAARTGAPCWSKRLRSARTRGTSEDLNVWPRRRRSSEPTVNRSIAQWAMSALFARTVSPSRRMGDVPRRARPRLAGRSVSEPRALAERVGVYCLALAPRLSPQATAFFDER